MKRMALAFLVTLVKLSGFGGELLNLTSHFTTSLRSSSATQTENVQTDSIKQELNIFIKTFKLLHFQ